LLIISYQSQELFIAKCKKCDQWDQPAEHHRETILLLKLLPKKKQSRHGQDHNGNGHGKTGREKIPELRFGHLKKIGAG